MGATAAIANKIIFQVTMKDAEGFAPEFAKKPPTEIRREEALSISQNPVRDLLNGHANAEVRALVNRSIRPIKERLEELQAEIESRKILRMEHQDEAAFSRICERIEVQRERFGRTSHQDEELINAREAGEKAKKETLYLEVLAAESAKLQTVLRNINKIFVAVMEGGINTDSDMYCKHIADIDEEFYLVIKIINRLYSPTFCFNSAMQQ